MKVAIVGQGTLAAATAACCAEVHTLTVPPDADLLWVCYDTPIGPNDAPDVNWVLQRVAIDLVAVPPETVVLISAQVPVGTTGKLRQANPGRFFAYSPENIRVATAESDFRQQARIVVGRPQETYDELFRELLLPFTEHLIFTSINTAEMAKHALNCYLGLCITFINEIAKICEVTDADANVVAQTLLLERRVSPQAPLKPGKPFGGGHLARDIYVLNELARVFTLKTPVISHITESNNASGAIVTHAVLD